MPRFLQKYSPLGGLDQDTSIEYIGDGNYRNALNIQHLTQNTESTQGQIPRRGNELSFSLGSVSTQNKTWRLYLEQVVAPNTGYLVFIGQNGEQLNSSPSPYPSPTVFYWDRSLGFAAQVTAISSNITVNFDPTATFSSVDTSGTNTAGYIDITLNDISGYDWDFFATYRADVFALVDDPRLDSILVREAYDTSLDGSLNVIGSNDLLSDLYIWSTPQTELPTSQQLTVTSVANNGSGRFRVTFSSSHGLTNGWKISLENSGTAIDGDWIVDVISPSVIDLKEYYSNFVAVGGGFVVTLSYYNEAVGELGVAQKNFDTSTWTYTRLLRTKEWNFRTKKQPDTYAERNSLKDSVYWTDDYNVPRCFYYTLPFVQDGGLSINGGRYDYGSIAEETRLILASTNVDLSFTGQVQGGGAIKSGNWRYSIRFLSDSLTPTEWTDLTNPINVFTASTGASPYLLIGDLPGVTTPKINQFEVSGIIPGLFKYIELAGVNYVGSAIEGYIIRRELLDNQSDTITIEHTGTESDVTDLDLATLNQFSTAVETAKNITVIDSRMVLSNITVIEQADLTTWAQTIEHSLFQKDLPTVGGNIQGNLRVAEYQKPENVNGYVGYMYNETYRFGVKLRRRDNGGWTQVFHIDDITFDTLSYARRNTTLSNFNLVDPSGAPFTNNNIKVPYIRFENINLDYLVNGKPIREIYDRIEIVRAECVQEVLASGIVFLGMNTSFLIPGLDSGGSPFNDYVGSDNPPSGITTTNTVDTIVANAFADYANSGVVGAMVTVRPQYGSFYSPDIMFSNTDIVFTIGDRMLNFGQPFYMSLINQYIDVNQQKYSYYSQTGGKFDTNSVGGGPNPIQDATLNDMQTIAKGGSATIGGITYQKFIYVDNSSIGGTLSTCDSPKSPVLYYSTGFTQPSPLTPSGSVHDFGIRYMQYFRPLSDKYGDVSTTRYVSTGAYASFDSLTASPVMIDTFGGDTFTQLVYLKQRAGDLEFNGFGGGISFYCQNRINSQMKTIAEGTTQYIYPGIGTAKWLATSSLPNEEYQKGYNIRNEVKIDTAFDPDIEQATDLPTRIIWSPVKPQNSIQDSYRIYLPLDFRDGDLSYGEIVHHANGNGELISWQERRFERWFFNTRGTLEAAGTSVVIGDGAVMDRDGVTISNIGCKHKWSIIKGYSPGGNDVFYWINTVLKKVARFGYDGTVSISDIKGMQSFFANNLTWVDNFDMPADGLGIHGVWDNRYADVVWTIRGINSTISEWDSGLGYANGAYVYYSTDPFLIYGDVYKNVSGVLSTNQPPDQYPNVWEKQPMGLYNNEYTIVLNEFKNKFTTFLTHKPKIYLRWRDTFLSPRPIADVSQLYEHNIGDYLTWYDNGSTSQTEEGYLTGVINDLDDTKYFEAISVKSEIVPYKFEFETKNHISYLDETEFTTREDLYYAPIKRDSTVTVDNPTGLNNLATSMLYGKYLYATMKFEVATYQELIYFLTKFRIAPRQIEK